MAKRVALALGSGARAGYAHIGVINELQARGYDVVGIAGSSMAPWWEGCTLPAPSRSSSPGPPR